MSALSANASQGACLDEHHLNLPKHPLNNLGGFRLAVEFSIFSLILIMSVVQTMSPV